MVMTARGGETGSVVEVHSTREVYPRTHMGFNKTNKINYIIHPGFGATQYNRQTADSKCG